VSNRLADLASPKETVDLKQLVLSEVIQDEALINLLERKGILTRGELLEEVKRVAAKMPKAEM
jgi:hypothetical protein